MNIREITIGDAANFINLVKKVEMQSRFMMMEAGERKTTSEQQAKQIDSIHKQSNSTIFVVELEDELIGYLFAIGGSVRKNKHSVYIAIGILDGFHGKGIGTSLFGKLEEWASNVAITRLELTVVTENKAGVALYMKRGFEIEGTKRNSLKINGKFYDEYYMSKLLEV